MTSLVPQRPHRSSSPERGPHFGHRTACNASRKRPPQERQLVTAGSGSWVSHFGQRLSVFGPGPGSVKIPPYL